MTDTYTPTEQQLRQEVEALRRDLQRAKDVALERASYEATCAGHHANWHAAFEWHTTRHAAMRDLIDAMFGELAKTK